MYVVSRSLICSALPRFVRREKEIAESRFEVAQGESLRYRLRVEHLERELKEVQDSLSATKERMQVCDSFHFILFFHRYRTEEERLQLKHIMNTYIVCFTKQNNFILGNFRYKQTSY